MGWGGEGGVKVEVGGGSGDSNGGCGGVAGGGGGGGVAVGLFCQFSLDCYIVCATILCMPTLYEIIYMFYLYSTDNTWLFCFSLIIRSN